MVERRKEQSMWRSATVIVTALGLLSTTATAQFYFVGSGSTVAGDYLRGVGIASCGMGQYNFLTARAVQIETRTAMELDNYLRIVVANENRARTESRAKRRSHRLRMFTEIRDRVLNNPAPSDLKIGNAHNALLTYLNAGSDSGMKLNPIVLPTDLVRTLPYKLNKEGIEFSMPRLTHKGKVPWPVAFQDKKFDALKVAYDRAMGNALDEQIEGKLSRVKIAAVKRAIEDLQHRLDQEVPTSADKYYMEGFNHLRELRAMYEGLKSANVQRAIADLDGYSGTTVYDLRAYMWGHDLMFGEPVSKAEKDAYRVLYDALVAQKDATEIGTRRAD
jgi:hypothetical protein